MIRIVREVSPKGFVSIRALGHADFGVRGKDVVCAAASALLQAWLRNLIETLGTQVHVELDRKVGRMVFIVPQDIEEEKRRTVEQLARYFYPSILSIAEQYPENILVSEIGAGGEAVCNASVNE